MQLTRHRAGYEYTDYVCDIRSIFRMISFICGALNYHTETGKPPDISRSVYGATFGLTVGQTSAEFGWLLKDGILVA